MFVQKKKDKEKREWKYPWCYEYRLMEMDDKGFVFIASIVKRNEPLK